jgi:hypothetical protein
MEFTIFPGLNSTPPTTRASTCLLSWEFSLEQRIWEMTCNEKRVPWYWKKQNIAIDTKAHNNDPIMAMAKVRDWLRTASGRKTIPGYSILTTQYQEFQTHLPELTKGLGFTVDNIPFTDFLNLVENATNAQLQ